MIATQHAYAYAYLSERGALLLHAFAVVEALPERCHLLLGVGVAVLVVLEVRHVRVFLDLLGVLDLSGYKQ